MPFHFCPHCGTKLEPEFRFCPSCGEKLPVPESPEKSRAVNLSFSSPTRNETATSAVNTRLSPSTSCEPTESTVHASITSTSLTPRPALRKTRSSLRQDREDDDVGLLVSPKKNTVTFKLDKGAEPFVKSPVAKSPRSVRGKGKRSSPVKTKEEEKKLSDQTGGVAESLMVDGSSPISSPIPKSPLKGKSKGKKAKYAPSVEPLPEGEEVTDTTGKKWRLLKQLSQSTIELIYEVSRTNSNESNHILKLGAKDGRLFNEQNFLQRAAKPASVEKWIKQNKLEFLGIPSCVGFGLHAESYRFLIFPSMGQSLHTVIEDENEPLSEKVVLQLTYRILEVLQYIHSNEYVHADICAENVYLKRGQKSQVYLVGYCHAFRYCPGGKHVEYREASRTPHEGSIEFISVDAHKGAAPSRRSDLQSLGYCMLHWHTGSLPWTELTQPNQVATQKQRYMDDVPALLSHCFGKKSVSRAFQTYLTTVMTLQYSEQPDYVELKAGLSAALLQLGASVDQPLSF